MGAHYSQLVFQPGEVPSYKQEDIPDILWVEDARNANAAVESSPTPNKEKEVPPKKIPVLFYEVIDHTIGNNAHLILSFFNTVEGI
jgi:hypothetical protein